MVQRSANLKLALQILVSFTIYLLGVGVLKDSADMLWVLLFLAGLTIGVFSPEIFNWLKKETSRQ